MSAKAIKRRIEFREAFQQDCETLIGRYVQHSTHGFEAFAEVWKELKFTLVYKGKYRPYEIGHFTIMVLHCAKKYFLLSECKFQKTTGLYLLYGLYYKQPIRDLIKIRLVYDELEMITRYLTFCKENNHQEPLFIFNQMLGNGAFDFVASQAELSIPVFDVVSTEVLVNDIYPKNSAGLVKEFTEVTSTSLSKICAIEDLMIQKLEAYKQKHKDVHVDTMHDVHLEMVENLSANKHLCNEDSAIDDTASSSNIDLEPEKKREIEEARKTSQMKHDIRKKAFAVDSRSKHLKQLVGKEKLRKNDS